MLLYHPIFLANSAGRFHVVLRLYPKIDGLHRRMMGVMRAINVAFPRHDAYMLSGLAMNFLRVVQLWCYPSTLWLVTTYDGNGSFISQRYLIDPFPPLLHFPRSQKPWFRESMHCGWGNGLKCGSHCRRKDKGPVKTLLLYKDRILKDSKLGLLDATKHEDRLAQLSAII